MDKDYQLGSVVTLKKPHACRNDTFDIIRIGADIKIECTNCRKIIMLSRADFNKSLKKVLRF